MKSENRRIWDCPGQSDRNCWSDDGMLAVVSKGSIQILIPMFDHTRFFGSHWVQIVKSDINHESIADKGRNSSSNRNDFRLWIAEKEFDFEITVGTAFEHAAWSPPGHSPGCPSLLATLLSNGMLILFGVCGCKHEDRMVTSDVKLHMFSTTLALDISTSFSSWCVHQKSGDCGADDVCDDTFPHAITTMTWYPNLVCGSSGGRRMNAMLLVTGSSHGAINLWLITRGSKSSSNSGWMVRCVGFVFLNMLGISSCRNADDTAPGPMTQMITALTFLPRARADRPPGNCETSNSNSSSSRSSSSSGNTSSSSRGVQGTSNVEISPSNDSLAHLLVCGTRFGQLMLLRLMRRAPSGRRCDGGDEDLLSFCRPPLQSLSLALGPIDSITVHANQHDEDNQSKRCDGGFSHLLYARCGARVVVLGLSGECLTQQFVFPDIHASLVTGIVAVPATRENAYRGTCVLTSSMDGQVMLWSRGNDKEDISDGRHSSSSSSSQAVDAPTRQSPASLPPLMHLGYPTTSYTPHARVVQFAPTKYLTFSRDGDGNSSSNSGSSPEFAATNGPLPVIDITVDSSQCLMATSHVTPRVLSRDRETQMNLRRLRTNIEVVFDLVPSLEPLWAFDVDLIVPIVRSVVLAHEVTAQVPTINVGFAGDEDEIAMHSSFCDGCTWLGGLTLAWLRSVEKYVEWYMEEGKMVFARQPGVPPNASIAKTGGSHSSSGAGADGSVHVGEHSTANSMQDAAEPDDDSARIGTGIIGVARRCTDLLHPPSMKDVVMVSVEMILVAATAVAQEINPESPTSPHMGANEALLEFPPNTIRLQSKIRLWQLVHNLLVVSSASSAAACTMFDRPPHIAELVCSLRSRLRVALSALSARRLAASPLVSPLHASPCLLTCFTTFYAYAYSLQGASAVPQTDWCRFGIAQGNPVAATSASLPLFGVLATHASSRPDRAGRACLLGTTPICTWGRVDLQHMRERDRLDNFDQ